MKTFLLLFLLSFPAFATTYIKNGALIEGVTSTVTSGGTTPLSLNSTTVQQFTGTQGHTVVLPDATTIPVGRRFKIINRSTLVLSVNSFGGGFLKSISPGSSSEFITTSVGSSAGGWDAAVIPPTDTPDFSGPLILSQIATPSNPVSGKYKLYFKSDGFLYRVNSGGSESQIGASTGLDGTLPLPLTEQASTPANPTAGIKKLYFKTDGKLYKLSSGGVETEIGAAPVGMVTGPGSSTNNAVATWNGTAGTTLFNTNLTYSANHLTVGDPAAAGGNPTVTINGTSSANIVWNTNNGGNIGSSAGGVNPTGIYAAQQVSVVPSLGAQLFGMRPDAALITGAPGGNQTYGTLMIDNVVKFRWGSSAVILTSGNPLLWEDDGSADFGNQSGNRPNNVYVKSKVQTGDGTAGAPTHSFGSTPNAGMYISAGTLAWSVSGVGLLGMNGSTLSSLSTRAVFGPASQVGIGSLVASPTIGFNATDGGLYTYTSGANSYFGASLQGTGLWEAGTNYGPGNTVGIRIGKGSAVGLYWPAGGDIGGANGSNDPGNIYAGNTIGAGSDSQSTPGTFIVYGSGVGNGPGLIFNTPGSGSVGRSDGKSPLTVFALGGVNIGRPAGVGIPGNQPGPGIGGDLTFQGVKGRGVKESGHLTWRTDDFDITGCTDTTNFPGQGAGNGFIYILNLDQSALFADGNAQPVGQQIWTNPNADDPGVACTVTGPATYTVGAGSICGVASTSVTTIPTNCSWTPAATQTTNIPYHVSWEKPTIGTNVSRWHRTWNFYSHNIDNEYQITTKHLDATGHGAFGENLGTTGGSLYMGVTSSFLISADNAGFDTTGVRGVVLMQSNDPVATNRTMILGPGTEGQFLIIIRNDPTNAFEVQSQANCHLNSTWTPADHGSLTLTYAGGAWWELARSVNN